MKFIDKLHATRVIDISVTQTVDKETDTCLNVTTFFQVSPNVAITSQVVIRIRSHIVIETVIRMSSETRLTRILDLIANDTGNVGKHETLIKGLNFRSTYGNHTLGFQSTS